MSESKITMSVEVSFGASINEAASEAQLLADLNQVNVKFEFNGHTMIAKPGINPKILVENYHSKLPHIKEGD